MASSRAKTESEQHRGPRRYRRRQFGVALLAFTTVLVVVAASTLVESLNDATDNSGTSSDLRDALETDESLVEARAALIAWTVAHQDRPGSLPYPTRDPAAVSLQPGCTVGPQHLLGRLPEDGGSPPCPGVATVALNVTLEDAADEKLWYAVSRNLVMGGGGGHLNPGLRNAAPFPWISVCDGDGNLISDRVAAVIIAPGEVLDGQTRGAGAPDAQDYLDSYAVAGHTYKNWDSDGLPDAPGCAAQGEDFIRVAGGDGDVFNDRLAYITVDELVELVNQRVVGEVANVLENYEATYGAYPWLGPFQSDPIRASGTAQSGSGATVLIDSTTDLIAAGVSVNDTIRNMTDGSIGAVTAVSTNQVTFSALGSGSSNAFGSGDEYEIQPAFRAVVGAREGHLPIHVAGQTFASGFQVAWSLPGAVVSRSSALVEDFDLQTFHHTNLVDSVSSSQATGALQVAASADNCIWEGAELVKCAGSTAGPLPPFPLDIYVASRTYVFDFEFTASAAYVTVGSNASASYKTRQVQYRPADDPAATQLRIRIVDRNSEGEIIGTAQLDPGAGTTGSLTVSGIHYFLEPGVDIPIWLVDNNWHHLMFAAVAAGHVDGGDGCTPGSNCLQLDVDGVYAHRDDVHALVVSAGHALAGQARQTMPACAVGSEGFCHFFELENRDSGDDRFEDREADASFNDRVRVVAPKLTLGG